MIEVRSLSKSFRDKKRGAIRAVDHVTFRCQPGQIYGLLGANGAGKTTTLRMLATILEPPTGPRPWGGPAIADHPQRRAPPGARSGGDYFRRTHAGPRHHDGPHHHRIHPRMPRSRQNRAFLDANHKRGGKTVRRDRHHPKRETPGGRLAPAASRK